MLKEGLLNNSGKSLHLVKTYRKNQEVNTIVQNPVDDMILKEVEDTKLSAKSEPQEYDNIDRGIDEKYMYGIDKFSLGDSHKE